MEMKTFSLELVNQGVEFSGVDFCGLTINSPAVSPQNKGLPQNFALSSLCPKEILHQMPTNTPMSLMIILYNPTHHLDFFDTNNKDIQILSYFTQIRCI